MAKKHRTKSSTPHRSATRRAATRRPAPPSPRHEPDPAPPDLMVDFRRTLRADDPLDLVGLVSAIIEVFQDQPDDLDFRELLEEIGDPDALPDDPLSAQFPGTVPFSLAGLVESFVATDIAETTAVLTVIAELSDDDLIAAKARREVARRRQPMPRHIAELASLRVDAAAVMSDELDDGANVILGLTWPGGRRQTSVTYIDHNLANGVPVIKDAFFVDESFDDTVAMFREIMAEQGERDRLSPLDLGDARVLIEEAMAAGAEILLPPESAPDDDGPQQWPQCRPFLAFVARRLPVGGRGAAERTPYQPLPLAEAISGFLASPHAAGLGTAQRAAAELLLAAAESRAGSPLRWSGVTVEVLLMDELPWDADAGEEVLDAIPDALEPVIRYAHGVQGISPEGTRTALDAVRDWLPQYATLRAMDTPRELRRSTAELAAMLAGDASPLLRRLLMEYVGSEEALDALDAEPLPPEEFDYERVPPPSRDRVAAVVGHLDRFAAAFVAAGFDAEFRSAAYRFLADVTERDPAQWRRAGRDDSAAAAVIWAVGRANDLLARPGARATVNELQAFFGLSASPAQRAQSMLKALGVRSRRVAFEVGLGDARYLTGPTRARLVRERDGLAGGWPGPDLPGR